MRHNESLPFKIWHADIEQSTLDSFTGLLPIDTARVWAVRTCLEKFLVQVEHDRELQDWIHRDIWRMLFALPKPMKPVPINVRIPTALYIRYDKLFPEWGSTTWFIRRVFVHVVDVLNESGFILDEMLDRAVSAALRHDDEASETLGRFEESA